LGTSAFVIGASPDIQDDFIESISAAMMMKIKNAVKQNFL
jgi:hypothetical protein